MEQDILLAMSLIFNVALWATIQQQKHQLTVLKDNAKRFEKY